MNRRRFTGISFLLTMLPVALPVSADAVAEARDYNYSDDWAIVSAPPPSGPYGAVNLDSRIPGQDVIRIPVKGPAIATASEIPADRIPVEVLENPPAAGMPVSHESGRSPAAGLNVAGAALPPPIPGRYKRMVRAYDYPTSPGDPVTAGFPPPTGYYGAVVQRVPQQVPPPPVYDAMLNKRESCANSRREGAP